MSDYKNFTFNDTEDEKQTAQDYFEQMNASLGNSLQHLFEPKHDVKGRETELHQLDIQMSRPLTPVCLLLGLAGSGKTALVETWLKRQKKNGKNVVLLSLALGAMSSDGRTMLQQRMEALMPKLKKYQDLLQKENPNTEVVLFIDEVHMVVSIFGKGSKLGGDLLKTSLARSYVKVIAATTRIEYDSYIASDAPLARRFKNLAINEVNKTVTKEILDSWCDTYIGERLPTKVLNKIIDANKAYRPQFAEPAKSIDILESAEAIKQVENIPIDEEMINRIFLEQFNINLNFQANFEHVYNTILRRVKGQPMALYTVERAVKKLAFNLTSSNRPKATMLFVGSSGVGKTEMTKALAEGVYDSEDKILPINMFEYATEDSEPKFRRDLGTAVRHDSDIVILLDELEKAHQYIKQDLLGILDEGIVKFTEVGADGYPIDHTISLKNTVIIGTSNAAAQLFKEAHRFSKHRGSINQDNMNEYSQALKQEYQDMEVDLYKALQKNFTPEFLGRFSNIIPFYALHESTLLEIARDSIMKMVKELNSRPDSYKIEIKRPKNWKEFGYDYVADEISMYLVFELANNDDSNFGGARAITRYVENELYMEILDAIFDPNNRDKRRFLVHTNGESAFESHGIGKGLGGIVVEPAN
ncbi:TPA: ATP-dependent Clp protease ATP-binding subunit [Staphylococcus aureus]|nr:ATP-dependent Clp protease ATP-binding subunit [Staphylococcus aureus]